MSSRVMTYTAAAASLSDSAVLETEVTSMSSSSAMLSFLSELAESSSSRPRASASAAAATARIDRGVNRSASPQAATIAPPGPQCSALQLALTEAFLTPARTIT